jgi:crotonobetainyl-CoA:carnitine CoA-transferase CaiB-like acyl-CoA transferase
LGLDPARLLARHHRLVFCSISGFGSDSPAAARPGHDINYLVASGAYAALSPAAPLPAVPGLVLADVAAGLMAALRIVSVLSADLPSAADRFVDVSLSGAISEWVDCVGGVDAAARLQGFLSGMPHYGTFTTADGEVLALGVVREDAFWRALCVTLRMPESVWGQDVEERLSNASELRTLLAKEISRHTRAELEEMLADVDTCWSFYDDKGGIVRGKLAATHVSVPRLNSARQAIESEFMT